MQEEVVGAGPITINYSSAPKLGIATIPFAESREVTLELEKASG